MAKDMAHRHKRPFQPTITSFFARAGRDNDSDVTSHTSESRASTSALDPHIQASLLSMPMRIRKAVPEGYKTGKNLFTDTTPIPSTSAPTIISTYSRAGPTELLPFCGLHKIGGMSVQPSIPVNAYNKIDIFNDNTPFSSQESATSSFSTDSMPATNPLAQISSNKRRYDDEEQPSSESEPEFEKSFFNFPVTPTYPISHTSMPDLAAISSSSSRAIAKPKSRRKPIGTITPEASIQSLGGIDGMDFEEANFLAPLGDDEVEMGGT